MAHPYYTSATTGTLPYPAHLFREEYPSLDPFERSNILYWMAKCIFDTPCSYYTLQQRQLYREQFLMLSDGLDGEMSSIWLQLLVRELVEIYELDVSITRTLILNSFRENVFDRPIPIREEWNTVPIY